MRVRIRRAITISVATALTAATGVVTAAVAMNATAATAACSVTYTRNSQWTGPPNGFTAQVTIANTGTTAISGWSLAFTFPGDQMITSNFNGGFSQTGENATLANASYNGAIAPGASITDGFQGTWTSNDTSPASFTLNGATCTGTPQPSPSPTTPSPTPSPTSPSPSAGTHTMGYIGCSMAQNTAQGYAADGGTRMWGPYATGGDVVQSWTDPNSSAWQLFDQQAAMFGKPTAVWVQVCVFTQGATIAEVDQMIANTRQHAAPGVTIFITGQPQYDPGHVCSLAGASGPALTDSLAQQAAADPAQNVTYKGTFHLTNSEVLSDTCHANTAGMADLGRQALSKWG
jgi:hypothetical protein